ncbi:hypothetical protein [Actinoplanes sp. RD1]|uniref:hypothetical protein n=1 Tax=Actinoplanes sp. RD1 TaxID=3064538 RepID=UPI0027407078|nr:hypothetical protein [Actinoplanes sp. RD1]
MTSTLLRITGVTLVATMLAGCGLLDPPQPPPTAPPAPSATAPGKARTWTEAELRSALLEAAELPGDFSAAPAGAVPMAGGTTGLEGCGASPAPSSEGSPSATAVFQGGMTGPFVAELLVSARSVPDATGAMAALRAAPGECAEFSVEGPDGTRLTMRLGQLSVPATGDETAAFRMTATYGSTGLNLYAHVVTVRLGAVLVMVTVLQLSAPDVATTGDVVRRAVTKARRTLS